MFAKQSFRTALLLSVAVVGSCQSLSAQTQITHEHNGMRAGDVLKRQQVNYIPSGDNGENLVWNISELTDIGDYTVEYCCDSDSTVVYEIIPTAINKYTMSGDTLFCIGYETPLKKMQYSRPVLNIVYPSFFRQYAEANYEGHGTYCQTHATESFGTVSMEADATGSLIVSEEDTLDNVIRVHSIKTGAIGMASEDSTGVDSMNFKQEIEDRYLWYARGYRYPVFETVSTSYYDNMDFVSCIQEAYIYMPDRQRQLSDEVNDEILREDSLSAAAERDIIHYALDYSGNTLSLSYDLDEDAVINTLICNKMGMLFQRKNEKKAAGTDYQMQFDCSGLRPDDYILYINVNGKVYSEKFKVR